MKVDGRQRERRFARNTPIKTIRRWQDETRAALRKLPQGARRTLAADVRPYLKQIEGNVAGIKQRRQLIGTWLPRFGHLQTLQLAHHLNELNEQMREWRKRYSASTCKHRRNALTNLVKVLYGRIAALELTDLVSFPEGPSKARWLEREHITAVLRELEPGTPMTARVQMLHCTGMRPIQLGRLTPDHFRLDDDTPHVIVLGAKGGQDAVIPLADEGIDAARQFLALNAYGPVDTSRANALLKKAARQARRPAFTLYQIRHSFATALRRTGTDLADIQNLYGHTSARTTELYAPAQLEKQREAIERMNAASSSGVISGDGTSNGRRKQGRPSSVKPATGKGIRPETDDSNSQIR